MWFFSWVWLRTNFSHTGVNMTVKLVLSTSPLQCMNSMPLKWFSYVSSVFILVFPYNTTHPRTAEAVWVRGHVGGCCSKVKCVTISLVMSSLLGCDCGANSRVDPQSHITLLRHVGVRVWPLHKFTYKHLDLLEPRGVSWRVSCVTTSLSRFSILFCQRLTLQSHFSKQQS